MGNAVRIIHRVWALFLYRHIELRRIFFQTPTQYLFGAPFGVHLGGFILNCAAWVATSCKARLYFLGVCWDMPCEQHGCMYSYWVLGHLRARCKILPLLSLI
jgi:hypothetical protein